LIYLFIFIYYKHRTDTVKIRGINHTISLGNRSRIQP